MHKMMTKNLEIYNIKFWREKNHFQQKQTNFNISFVDSSDKKETDHGVPFLFQKSRRGEGEMLIFFLIIAKWRKKPLKESVKMLI